MRAGVLGVCVVAALLLVGCGSGRAGGPASPAPDASVSSPAQPEAPGTGSSELERGNDSDGTLDTAAAPDRAASPGEASPTTTAASEPASSETSPETDAETEPVATETEPVATEPAATEPVATEPAAGASSYRASSYQKPAPTSRCGRARLRARAPSQPSQQLSRRQGPKDSASSQGASRCGRLGSSRARRQSGRLGSSRARRQSGRIGSSRARRQSGRIGAWCSFGIIHPASADRGGSCSTGVGIPRLNSIR